MVVPDFVRKHRTSKHLTMPRGSCVNYRHLGKTVVFVGTLFLFCEVLIYYVVLLQCTWPQIDTKTSHSLVKAVILADTHLLGPRFGHWFDKLRREWQMFRAFQTTMALHNPNVVFILGDIFDEGFHCSDEEFNNYIKRFHSLFSVPEHTKLYVVMGNHDVGFHYRITQKLEERFEKSFNLSAVEMLNIRGNIFILVNSMALHGDNCYLCAAAEEKLHYISKVLKCAKESYRATGCDKVDKLVNYYSKPIFLQHFPLYRKSDADCREPDSAPPEIIGEPFRETWECLSRESTEKVLNWLEPRVVFSGHTHHGCHRVHRDEIPEWTIPSYSWRNKKNPSFILAVFAPDAYAVKKCYMPRENTVINSYIVGTIMLLIWIYVTRWKFFTAVSIKDKL